MWIESHEDIKDHPKTSELRAKMGWDLSTAVGKIHLLWWWCMKYAEDGDLSKHTAQRIAVGIDSPAKDARKIMNALISSGWVDRKPYLRLHDWWQYAGPFLRSKYKRNPEKAESVRNRYVTVTQPLRNPRTEQNLTNLPTKDVNDVASQVKLKRINGSQEVVRMPWGEKKGVRIVDLEPSYCSWLLSDKEGQVRMCPGLWDALQAHVRARAAEKI